MDRRNFAAGVLVGAIFMGVALFAGALAVQDNDIPRIATGEQRFVGDDLAFVTSVPNSDPLEGRLMVRVDGQWRDVQFEVRMLPVN